MCTHQLCLVDGYGILYRSFFGIPPLSTSAGVPTNAVLGFIRAVRQILNRFHPSHFAVVFDGGLSAERLTSLPEYKAQRPRMPDELRSQVALSEEFLERAGIPWMRIPGQEADDVIATLAKSARAQGATVRVITSDKDLMQIVGDGVTIVSASNLDASIDTAAVLAKTGVPPERIVEWLALTGDQSDNIRGIPGIGPKTASKLLNRFGSIEDLMLNLGSLPEGKTRRELEAGRATVARNMELVRLRDEMYGLRDWKEMTPRNPDKDALIAFLERLELFSLVRDVRTGMPGSEKKDALTA